MSMRLVLVIGVGCLLLASEMSRPVSAQSGRRPPRPFDASVQSLPPGFRGEEIPVVYEWLARQRTSLDAFATHDDRVQAETRRAAQSGLCGNLYAFVTAATPEWLQYDPDDGEFAVRGFNETLLLLDSFPSEELAVNESATSGAGPEVPRSSAEAARVDDSSGDADEVPRVFDVIIAPTEPDPDPVEPDVSATRKSTPGVRRLSLARTSLVRQGMRRRSTYSGRNAFGVARRVVRTTGTNFVLTLLFREVDWRFKMAPDQARKLASKLDIVFVVSFCTREPDGIIGPENSPWRLHACREYVSGHAPTLDEPSDTEITNYEIEASLRQLHVVDRSSGRILARYTCPDIRALYWQKIEKERQERAGRPLSHFP